jgi:metal-responsive CopG/Arc/MetJ family transcriptional regulator
MITYNDRIGIKLEHTFVNEIDTLTSKYNRNRSKIVRQLLLLGFQMYQELNNLYPNENDLQRQ